MSASTVWDTATCTMPASHQIRRPDAVDRIMSYQPMWMGSRPGAHRSARLTRARNSGRPSGSGAERVQCNCLPEGVAINRTPSPYQPTRMYALRHSANVNGSRSADATSDMMVLSRFASDYIYIGGQSGCRIS